MYMKNYKYNLTQARMMKTVLIILMFFFLLMYQFSVKLACAISRNFGLSIEIAWVFNYWPDVSMSPETIPFTLFITDMVRER